ncbi:MAG: YqaA family protein [Thiohalorhabdus sp.]|uniref:YqaA family protein n=1 Tax=Thiohalorhabdus sp. TaxID=3094134 RepID=UPI0039802BA8
MIRQLVRWALVKAGHPRAPLWLGALSFAESSFFPVPPDVLMAPMALARPRRAWYFAALTTATSVAGGLLGYLIGAFLYQAVAEPLLAFYGAEAEYARVAEWFGAYGAWAVFLAGLTPVPYKVFTLGAGSLQMPLLPFVLGSLGGRGLRFFVLAGVIRLGGERLYRQVEEWSPVLFWTGMAALAGLILLGLDWDG